MRWYDYPLIFLGSFVIGYMFGAPKALGYNDWKHKR